jgi:2-polyprenyl-6-methoxyphenol hydroxylase-like FAD-dependent oxidoreductase
MALIGVYDLIVVGGGLGGSSLSKAMAESGARVLLLEREEQFRDRVRGEAMWPWGFAELQALGIDSSVFSRFATEKPYLDVSIGGEQVVHRDVISTSNQKLPLLNWVHYEMEEGLLQAAQKAGAEIFRGARAFALRPAQQTRAGSLPTVSFERNGRNEEAEARLIVCADGRSSLARKWGGFDIDRDPNGTLFAGVLVEGVELENNSWFMNPAAGQFAFVTPQTRNRVRAYAWYPNNRDYRLQGAADFPRFVEESVKAGVPSDWFTNLRLIGPLATFDGTESWVKHPYRDGVALLGDAAAASDPSHGQGQSLTLRDARVLRDQLLASSDWDAAGDAYADEHDRYFTAVHKFYQWFWQILYDPSPAGAAHRSRVLPRLARDLTLMPDALASGPEVSLDEPARRRFFAED